MYKLQSYSFSTQKESNVPPFFVHRLHYTRVCGTSHCFMCHVSVIMYDFKEKFSTPIEIEKYTVFRLGNFLYDPCMSAWKSYITLV